MGNKTYLDIDVYEAAVERTAYTFDNFDRVYLSFSAGKDSTVMLHIAAAEARRREVKFGLLLVDLEGQYKLTIEHALELFEEYSDCIIPFWICAPLALRNAVSVYEPKWECWDPDKQEIWIRQPPKMAITDMSLFHWFERGMEFEEFVPQFGEWFAEGKTTACMVGIRTDESLNRWRSLTNTKKNMFDNKLWTTKVTDNVYNVYPVYDWRTEDIWTYHARFPEHRANYLYDLMGKAGLTISQQRICQPYGDDQRRGLWLFHLIEPETWARVVARVNGANSGALYMQEWGNINGYRKITKPEGHTWRSFADLLIHSLPPHMTDHYKNKIMLHEKYWAERGYPDGMPDESDPKMEAMRKAPSWRRVCKSLLRNDYWCKGLGFSQTKSGKVDQYNEMMRKRKERWGKDQDQLGYVPVNEQLELV